MAEVNLKQGRSMKAFEAGKTGRRLRAIPNTTVAINHLIRTYGASVLARSRHLAVNNPYVAAAKEEFTAALAGTGIKPSPLVKDRSLKEAISLAFADWTDEADADWATDFYGLQATIASELFEAGECFVRIRKRRASDGLSVPFQLQVIPAEMLPLDMTQTVGRGNKIDCGIEFDAIGRRVAYHFYKNHPGDSRIFADAFTTVRVPADQVLHLYKPYRAGQIRGVSHIVPSIVPSAILDLYDDAELERKRTAALFGAFLTRTKPETDEEPDFLAGATEEERDEDDAVDVTLEPGAVADLPEGRDIRFSAPADVGETYEIFQYRMLTRIASGMGATYAGMTGDLKSVNYSSDRSGMVRFRRKVEMLQHHVMVFQFCRPVWKFWLDNAVSVGAIESLSPSAYLQDPRSFQRAKWIPPRWEWVDPLKDRQAEKLAVDSGFKARSDVIEAEGYDPEEVDDRIANDQQRAAERDIGFTTSKVIIAPGAGLLDSAADDEDIFGDNEDS